MGNSWGEDPVDSRSLLRNKVSQTRGWDRRGGKLPGSTVGHAHCQEARGWEAALVGEEWEVGEAFRKVE